MDEGLEKLFTSFRCDYELAEADDGCGGVFGEGVLYQVWAMWNKVDPRYLSIHLISASDLPPMDGSGTKATTDAYAVAYIVPPDPDLPESPLKATSDVELPPPSPAKGILGRMGLTSAAAALGFTSDAAAPSPAPPAAPSPAPAPAAAKAAASPDSALARTDTLGRLVDDAAKEERAAVMMQSVLRGNNARRKGGWGAGVRAKRSEPTRYRHCLNPNPNPNPKPNPNPNPNPSPNPRHPLCSRHSHPSWLRPAESRRRPSPLTPSPSRTRRTPHPLHPLPSPYAVRDARRKTVVARRLQALTAMPAFAVKAVRSGDVRLALKRLIDWAKGALRLKVSLQMFHGGPRGAPGQVRVRVRVWLAIITLGLGLGLGLA